MSLVSTYCLCEDGYWYQNPLWHGDLLTDGTYPWFICLDDDDPPELVVQEEYKQFWPKIDWFEPTEKAEKYGSRLFDEGPFDKEPVPCFPAIRQFGELTKLPPKPQRFDKRFEDRPDCQGVFYDASSV